MIAVVVPGGKCGANLGVETMATPSSRTSNASGSNNGSTKWTMPAFSGMNAF